MPQLETLTERQPTGAVAADSAAADDLALLRHMLWSQLSFREPELTMQDRLLERHPAGAVAADSAAADDLALLGHMLSSQDSAADRTAADHLALLRHMLSSQLSSREPELTMQDRLLECRVSCPELGRPGSPELTMKDGLLERQPAGAVAADRVAADHLALLGHMLWSQDSAADRVAADHFALLWHMLWSQDSAADRPAAAARRMLRSQSKMTGVTMDRSFLIEERVGGTTVGLIRRGSVFSLVWSRFIFAFRSWVTEAVRRWQESPPEKQQLPGPQPFLSSPAFLVAEIRWQWHLMVGQPITLAAATAACLWAWLGPVNGIITGTLILAALAGVLWLLPFQASPGTAWRLRFLRLIGLPTFYVASDAALNVLFNALGQADWLRTLLLSALLVASFANVVLVLTSWGFVPVEVSLRQVSSGLRTAADKVDSLHSRKENSSAKDVGRSAPGL